MKGIYSATDFHRFRISDRLEELLEDCHSLTVGIDLAKHEHYACVMRGFEDFGLFRFHNSELHDFALWLDGLGVEITVVVEPTGTYGDPLVDQLRGLGIEVKKVPAKRTHDLCDLFDNVPSKFDGKCAYLLARLHLIELSEELRQMTDRQRQLRALHAGLDDAHDEIRRISGKLESMLARHWPDATSYLSLSSVTLLRTLSEFGGPTAVAAQPEKARAFMRRVGRSNLAIAKIDALIDSARARRGVELREQEARLLQRRAAKLLQAKREERDLKKDLEAFVRDDPELEHIAEYCGPALATAAIAFVGPTTAFTSAAALEKCAGLNLRWFQSGEARAGGFHISKRGPGIVRSLLFFFALRMIQKKGCPITRAWYRKRLELNGGHKLKAIVAVMRKLIRALYHVGRGVEFDPTQLFDVSRLQVEPA